SSIDRCGRRLAVSFGVPAVPPVQVLEDPLRVVDDLVAIDEHRHAPLASQLLDLGPSGAPVGDPLRPVAELEPPKPPRHRAARAEHVGAVRAAVEDDHWPSILPASRSSGPSVASAASCGLRPTLVRSPSASIC